MASSLALLSQAAEGNTFEELRTRLQLSNNKTIIADQFNQYHRLLQKVAGKSTLSIANKIYVQQGHQINKQFKYVTKNKFVSDVESLNFVDSKKSARAINHFVARKTHEKIQNLIEPDKLDGDSRVVLVNAVYFKGNWKYQFDKERTQKSYFYASEKEIVPGDFMTNKGNYSYAELEDLDATALEMKYANSDLAFVIVLPNNRFESLSVLEAKLAHYSLDKIVEQMNLEDIYITIPKFKVEFEMQLNNVLQNVRILCFITMILDESYRVILYRLYI